MGLVLSDRMLKTEKENWTIEGCQWEKQIQKNNSLAINKTPLSHYLKAISCHLKSSHWWQLLQDMMITEQLKHFQFANGEKAYQTPLLKSVRWWHSHQIRGFHFKDVKLKDWRKIKNDYSEEQTTNFIKMPWNKDEDINDIKNSTFRERFDHSIDIIILLWSLAKNLSKERKSFVLGSNQISWLSFYCLYLISVLIYLA